MFYEKFVQLCASAGKSPSAVALEIGLQKSNVTYWKNGNRTPSDVTLQKIAQYFNVPVSYFSEDPKKEKSPATNESDKALEEFEVLFNQLSPEQKERELAYLRSLLADANK